MPDSVFLFRAGPGGYAVVPASCTDVHPAPIAPPVVADVVVEAPAVRSASSSPALNVVQARPDIRVQCGWSKSAVEPLHPGVWPPTSDDERVWPAVCIAGMNVVTTNVPNDTPVTITVHHCEPHHVAAPPGFARDDNVPDPYRLCERLVVRNNRVVQLDPAPALDDEAPLFDIRVVGRANQGDSDTRKTVQVAVADAGQVVVAFAKPGRGSNIVTAVAALDATAIAGLVRPILADRSGMWKRQNRLVVTLTGDNSSSRRRTRLDNVKAAVRAACEANGAALRYRDDLLLPDGIAAPAMAFGSGHDLWPIWNYPYYFFKVIVHLGQADYTPRATDLGCWSPAEHWTHGVAAACLRLKRWHVYVRDENVNLTDVGTRDSGDSTATDAFKATGWNKQIVPESTLEASQEAADRWAKAIANSYFAVQRSHGRLYVTERPTTVPNYFADDAYNSYCHRVLPKEIDDQRAFGKRKDRVPEHKLGALGDAVNRWMPADPLRADMKGVFIFGDPPKRFDQPDPNAISHEELATAMPRGPKMLMYFNTCRATGHASLARAFLAKGTKYVIGARVAVQAVRANNALTNFMTAWLAANCDPARIGPLFDAHIAPELTGYQPMLIGGAVDTSADEIARVIAAAYAPRVQLAPPVQLLPLPLLPLLPLAPAQPVVAVLDAK